MGGGGGGGGAPVGGGGGASVPFISGGAVPLAFASGALAGGLNSDIWLVISESHTCTLRCLTVEVVERSRAGAAVPLQTVVLEPAVGWEHKFPDDEQ